MKNIFGYITIAALCALLAGGCEKREAMAGTGGVYEPDTDGTGYIVMSDNGLTVEFDGERVNDSEQGSPATRAGENPDTADFWVEIIDTETEQPAIARFKYGERGSEPIELPFGTYYIRAYSGDKYKVEGESFWDGDGKGQPSWAGQSRPFALSRQHTKDNPYEAGNITCTMQTVKVSLVLEKALAARFNADKTNITVAISEDDRYDASHPKHSVEYKNTGHRYGLAELDKSHKITTVERESDICYLSVMNEAGGNAMFVYIDTEFTELEGTVRPLEMALTIASPESGVQSGQWRKITLYLDAVDEETGRITIGAQIETWVYNEEVVVDASSKVAEFGERVIMDMDPQMLRVGSDDFDLHTGVVNQLSYNADGQFIGMSRIDIKNNAGGQIDRFMVNISTQNTSFASFLGSLKMNGEWINLLSSDSDEACAQLYGWGFPRKGTIQEYGSESFQFSIKSLLDRLYVYQGRHEVGMAVVSGDYYYRADLILNVAGGSDAPAGDAPSIVWVGHNIDQRYDVTEGLQVQVTVEAPAGIKEFMVEIEGALREDLPSVGLVEEFSLVNPDLYKEGLGKSIEQLGFPIGDDVLNRTQVGFDISDFMVLLGTFYGNNDFRLTVTDNNGKTTTKTVMLHVN